MEVRLSVWWFNLLIDGQIYFRGPGIKHAILAVNTCVHISESIIYSAQCLCLSARCLTLISVFSEEAGTARLLWKKAK